MTLLAVYLGYARASVAMESVHITIAASQQDSA